jgi:hypothetical protein
MPTPPLSLASNAWRITALTLSILAVAFISIQPQVSTDFWLQVKIGELIALNHSVPDTLLFPFTQAQHAPFHAHEWLPSILFYVLTQSMSEDALGPVLGVLGLLLFGVMVALAFQRSRGCMPVALMLGLLAMVTENCRHILRPEMLSLILLGVYFLALDSFRQHNRHTAAITSLLVVVLWANTHGSYLLAPLISAIFAAGIWLDRRRTGNWTGLATPIHFVWLTLGTLLCSLLNVDGLDSWRFVVEFTLGVHHPSGFAARDFVTEWLPPTDPRLRNLPTLWIGLGCLVPTTALLLRGWRKLSSVDSLLFAMFIVLALNAIRFFVYIGIASLLVLAPLVPPGWHAAKLESRLFATLLALSAVTFGLAFVYGNVQGNFPYRAVEPYTMTESMVRALDSPSLKGNVLNTMEMGGELIYRTYPRLRPSIDPRIDAYGGRYYLTHEHLFYSDAELAAFQKAFQVKYLLLDMRHFTSLRKLQSWTQGHYKILSLDHKAVLLEYISRP